MMPEQEAWAKMSPSMRSLLEKEHARKEGKREAYEAAARIIEEAQIFHCWGDHEIDGLAVQKRLAAEIRSRLKETQ